MFMPSSSSTAYRYPASLPSSRLPSREPSPDVPLPKRAISARPTRSWYALLASLLTQVALEGVRHDGWKGGEAVELVLGVGTGGVRGGRGSKIGDAAYVLLGG